MKKELNIVIAGMFLVLLSGFVLAQGPLAIHEPGTGLEDGAVRGGGMRMNALAGNYFGEGGQQMQIHQQKNNMLKLEVGGVSVDCDCNMTQEQIRNNTRLYVGLSNGRNAEVKVMPDIASQTALKRLKLKTCDEEQGCLMELKEVGVGDKARLAYELNTQRRSKVLGLFGARMQVQTQVDAETGEIIDVNKPWWAFLASEPLEE